jgi:hypothetical protein
LETNVCDDSDAAAFALPPTPARTFTKQESPPAPPPQQSEGGSGRSLQHLQVTGVKRGLAVSDSPKTDDPFDASNTVLKRMTPSTHPTSKAPLSRSP